MLLLVAPSIIFMLFLFAYPMVVGIIAVFQDGTGHFTFANWLTMGSNPLFGQPCETPCC